MAFVSPGFDNVEVANFCLKLFLTVTKMTLDCVSLSKLSSEKISGNFLLEITSNFYAIQRAKAIFFFSKTLGYQIMGHEYFILDYCNEIKSFITVF